VSIVDRQAKAKELFAITVLTDHLRGQAFFGGCLAGRFLHVIIDWKLKGNENKRKHPIKVPSIEQSRFPPLSLSHVHRATLLSDKHHDCP